jgi:hypothetical protein
MEAGRKMEAALTAPLTQRDVAEAARAAGIGSQEYTLMSQQMRDWIDNAVALYMGRSEAQIYS